MHVSRTAFILHFESLLVLCTDFLVRTCAVFGTDSVQHVVFDHILARRRRSLHVVVRHHQEGIAIVDAGARHSCLWCVKVLTA